VQLKVNMTLALFRRAGWGLCALLLMVSPRLAYAQNAVSHFLQVRRSLGSAVLPGAQMVSAQADPASYGGQTFEVTAQVGGFVTADNVRTALLSLGTLSLAVRMPTGTGEGVWLASGQTVRALVRVEAGGADVSPRLSLLAAAPEADVAALERREVMRASLPSRSAPSLRSEQNGRMRAQNPRRWGADAARLASASVNVPAGLPARAQQIYAPYWNAVRRMNPRLASADVDKITTSILYFSDRNDVDPRLIMAMIICESGFDIHSTSRTGAAGLGQLMPGTARGLGVTDPYDPIQNIGASVRLLRGHLDNYGGAPAHAGIIPLSQIALTMAAYNAGPGAVRRYHGVPPYRETRRYVAKVAALYQKMCGTRS